MAQENRCLRRLPLKFRYTSGEDDPLHDFYIPVLRAARRYDRAVGFFSSNAFVVAAQGIAHLIAHGGTMRLLVGAQLSPEDAEAIRRGEEHAEAVLTSVLARVLPDPDALADHIARHRLEALAWMVAQGRLTIKVVLPANYSEGYFHIKIGVLTDTCDHIVAFQGSINETAAAWQVNYEDFSVFCSWKPGDQERVEDFRREFERIWRNEHPHWRAYPIPEAIRQRLLRYTPPAPPRWDPLERVFQKRETAEPPGIYRSRSVAAWVARFLRDAPFFPNAARLGEVTAAVRAWPHQAFVLHHILERYPQRFLIADEVGLGKTIEAGLLLRQLKLMGLARRVLILAPKSVLRQWQEELYEKFNLSVPIYDGRDYCTRDGQRYAAPKGTAAWEAEPWLLVSAQLARRVDRREDLLEAERWDVVVVDEAHHARRRDFQDLKRYRPNQLLVLLQQLALRTEFLLLLTATPMQVHPIEVWDLLALLGLSGRWALDHGKAFLSFFEALDERPIRWEDVLPLVRDELEVVGKQEWDAHVSELSAPQRLRVSKLLMTSNPTEVWRRLTEEQRQTLEAPLLSLARRHTPLRRLVLRHTRDLLRRYREQGLLEKVVPRRDPRPRWIPMSEEEAALYRAVSEYIATFYRRYEESQRGLGFVLTVYRRRLTSSLYALRRSLERRLVALQQRQRLLDVDDEASAERLFLEDESPDDLPGVSTIAEDVRQQEIRALEALLERVHALGDHDSKSAQLLQDLAEILKDRDRVLIFTQYTDTLDYLRERLRVVYGSAVACYSGRGGERWDGTRWKPVSKEEVKNAFAAGDVRILLATDAASEGLNLQTCGVLINYDMPWNPMRVEQRIGRIDRIGQRHEDVWLYHYFYEGTIEEKVYRRLGERIGFFRQVLGPLQPILEVEDLLERLAVLLPEEQEARLEQELQRLERASTTASFDLDEWVGQSIGHQTYERSPWTPEELEAWVAEVPVLRQGLHPVREGVYRLDAGNSSSPFVTFRPSLFEAHPDTMSLLTYGSAAWDAWLEQMGSASGDAQISPNREEERILVLRDAGPPITVAWYVRTPEGRVRRIATLSELRDVLDDWEKWLPWDEASRSKAQADFDRLASERTRRLHNNRVANARLQRSALQAQGIALLRRAAALALALVERDALFARRTATPAQAWRELADWGEPFGVALRALGLSEPPGIDEEAYHHFSQQKRREDLTRARQRLQREIEDWLMAWETNESAALTSR